AFLLFPLQVLGLALANTIQITFHALLLFVLLVRTIGWINGRAVAGAAAKVAVSAAAMAGVIVGVTVWVTSWAAGSGLVVWQVLMPATAGGMTYVGCLYLVRLDEVWVVKDALTARFGRPQSR